MMETLSRVTEQHQLSTDKHLLAKTKPDDEAFQATAKAVNILQLDVVREMDLKKYLEALKTDLQQLKLKINSGGTLKYYQELPVIFESFCLNICHLNKVSAHNHTQAIPSMNGLLNILLIIKDFVELCEKNKFSAIESSLEKVVQLDFKDASWVPSTQKSMLQKSLEQIQASFKKMQASLKEMPEK